MSSPRHTASRFLPKPTFPAAPPPPPPRAQPHVEQGGPCLSFPSPLGCVGSACPPPPPVSPPSPTHPGGARWCRPQCSSSSRRVSPSLTRSQPDALSSAVSFQHFGTFSRVSGKEKYKRKTILPLRGSPNPFPILPPSPSNFCPISPTALPALSLGSGPALPLLPHSVPSPFVPSRPALSARGGGWPHSFHGDGGGGCRKSTKTRGGVGGRGGGSGDVAQRAVRARGAPPSQQCNPTSCFNSCFWPRAPFFLEQF